jgi:hypothetical protein
MDSYVASPGIDMSNYFGYLTTCCEGDVVTRRYTSKAMKPFISERT